MIGAWNLKPRMAPKTIQRGLLERSALRSGWPWPLSFASSRWVQSQSQQAHGSVPFSWRQFRRECASFTLNNSKYSPQ